MNYYNWVTFCRPRLTKTGIMNLIDTQWNLQISLGCKNWYSIFCAMHHFTCAEFNSLRQIIYIYTNKRNHEWRSILIYSVKLRYKNLEIKYHNGMYNTSISLFIKKSFDKNYWRSSKQLIQTSVFTRSQHNA